MKYLTILVAALVLAGCATTPIQGALPTPTLGASVERLKIVVPSEDDVHEGTARYPLGFGSGLDFVGVSNGELVFWGITDRGPNLDGPAVGSLTSKVFPAPHFVPSVVEVRVRDGVARVTRVVPLKAGDKTITGLPLAAGTVGFSQEVALSLDGKDLGSDANGLDTEAIRLDPKNPGTAWISDEYGPFIAQVDLPTGKILKKFGPGSGLPEVLARRQPNRGMEGLAITPRGQLVGVIQSVLDVDGKVKTSKAPFVRLVNLDPASGKTTQYGYPIDADRYKKNADAKIGDLVALSETEFLILEQGSSKAGPINLVYKLSLQGATDLSGKAPSGAEWETLAPADLAAAGVVLATKTLVADLRDWGWTSEKAEGLAVLDGRRFAVISDNDFGVATEVVNPAQAGGKPVTDSTAYALEGGVLTYDGKPTEAKLQAADNKQPTAFWIYTTLKPFF